MHNFGKLRTMQFDSNIHASRERLYMRLSGDQVLGRVAQASAVGVHF